jgi:class 3 adenylate cyclase
LKHWVHRYYPIHNLSFGQFNTVVDLFLRLHPAFKYILYTLQYLQGEVVELPKTKDLLGHVVQNTGSAEEMRKRLARDEGRIRKYFAHLRDKTPKAADAKCVSFEYKIRAATTGEKKTGLYFSSEDLSRLDVYLFEQELSSAIKVPPTPPTEYPMGAACELLAVVVDMRDFTEFCEQPQVESPYMASVLAGFYNLMMSSFNRFPPNIAKLLGDGMVAIWELSSKERPVAIEMTLRGVCTLITDYRRFRSSSELVYGAPEKVAAGMSAGLGARFADGKDYAGRPIIVANRLCAICPGDHLLVDRSVPIPDIGQAKSEDSVTLKSFGEFPIWRVGPVV